LVEILFLVCRACKNQSCPLKGSAPKLWRALHGKSRRIRWN
jgi:hypothetical protein